MEQGMFVTERGSIGSRLSGLLVLTLLLTLAVMPTQVEARPTPKPRLTDLTVPATVVAGQVLVIRGSVKLGKPAKGLSVAIQRLSRKRWITAARVTLGSRGGRFSVHVKMWQRSGTAQVRVVIVRGNRRLAIGGPRRIAVRTRDSATVGDVSAQSSDVLPGALSPTTAPLPPPGPPELPSTAPPPAGTHEYGATEILAAAAAPVEGQATIEVPNASAPPAGGHVAIGVTPDFPRGMFGTVTQRVDRGETAALTIEPAAIADVAPGLEYHFDGDVSPTVVDEDGNPVPDGLLRAGTSGEATLVTSQSSRAALAASTPFTCTESGGAPRSADDLWSTGAHLPIEVKLENLHVLNNFDAGNLLLGREPSLLLQFSGQAIASIDFEANTGFSCQLSTTYRNNHRLRVSLPPILGVPVQVELTPMLTFEVSAAGKVGIKQRHYFSATFIQDGFGSPQFRLGHSEDPATLDFDAALAGSLWAGGQLGVFAGGGYKSANAQAGVRGDFGPKFTVKSDTTQPGCIHLQGQMEADLNVVLKLWVKEWAVKLASLTTAPKTIGDPICGLRSANAPHLNKVAPVDGGTKFTWSPPAAIPELSVRGVRCEFRDPGQDGVSQCAYYTYLHDGTHGVIAPVTASPGYEPGEFVRPGREYRIIYVYDGIESPPSNWVASPTSDDLDAPRLNSVAPVDGGTKFTWSPPAAIPELSVRGVRCEFRDPGQDGVSQCAYYTYLHDGTHGVIAPVTASPGYEPGEFVRPGREYRIIYVYDGIESPPSNWVST